VEVGGLTLLAVSDAMVAAVVQLKDPEIPALRTPSLGAREPR